MEITTKIGKAADIVFRKPRFYNRYHAADIRELAEPGSQLAMEAQRYLDEAAEGFKELSEKCPWRYTKTRCMAHDHSGGDYRDDDPEFNMCDEETCAVYHFLAKLQNNS